MRNKVIGLTIETTPQELREIATKLERAKVGIFGASYARECEGTSPITFKMKRPLKTGKR